MIRDDLIKRLKRLDYDASLQFEADRRFRMIIVGGSALILLEMLTRATMDIDTLYAPRELLDLMEKYDINAHVETYINNFPYNFEDRLVQLPIEGERIDFYTASLEDIVVAKLYSSRDTDRQDIISETVLQNVSWDELERLAFADDEAKASALNDRAYQDFLDNYMEYVRRFRP